MRTLQCSAISYHNHKSRAGFAIELDADFQQFRSVFPRDPAEQFRGGEPLQRGQRFLSCAFAAERGLRLTCAVAVAAAAIAAEDQLTLVTDEERGGELGVAIECVAAGVCGEVAVDIGEVGEEVV